MKNFVRLSTLSFLLCITAASAGQKQPNILVFLVDDMGVMDTSVPFMVDAMGKPERHPLNDFYRTPNMERIAHQGIRFRQFYANSVCSPSRVSLLTGQSSARHRTTQWIMAEANRNTGKYDPQDWNWKGITREHKTLPAILRKAGYRTIHVGKGHVGPNGSFGELPQNFGFDVNIAGSAYGQPGSYYGTHNFSHYAKTRQYFAVPGLEKYHGKDIHLTEALTLEMNAAIKTAVEDKKPFFAYMSHYAVHTPFQEDPRYAANYAKFDVSSDAKAFATMIEGVDKSLGDILDQLETLGVAGDTLVFFLGDNGTDAPLGGRVAVASAAPLRGKKARYYEGGIRVPFIAAWARQNADNAMQKALPIPSDILTDQIGTIYDLLPTILNITNIQGGGDVIDGVDISPLLIGERSKRVPTFLMHFPHYLGGNYYTVYREGDWKLIYHYHRQQADRCELFNLREDRGESENLAASRPEKRRYMIKTMAAALENANAQYPVSEKDQKTILKPEVYSCSVEISKPNQR